MVSCFLGLLRYHESFIEELTVVLIAIPIVLIVHASDTVGLLLAVSEL